MLRRRLGVGFSEAKELAGTAQPQHEGSARGAAQHGARGAAPRVSTAQGGYILLSTAALKI